MDSDVLGRSLLVLGAVLALVGAGVLLFPRIPYLGRLPRDISLQRDDFSLFVPIVTCIVLSLILTVIVNVAIRFLR